MNIFYKSLALAVVAFSITACGIDETASHLKNQDRSADYYDVVVKTVGSDVITDDQQNGKIFLLVTANIEFAGNRCMAINADKIALRSRLQGENIEVKAYRTPTVIFKEIICTAEYNPVFKDITLKIDISDIKSVSMKHAGAFNVSKTLFQISE